MTRHQGFDVRVAPGVEDVLHRANRGGGGLRARFLVEMERLAANGLRARSVRKLSGLDLWEVRVGDHRAFIRPVPGTRAIAVGALVPKRTRRLRMERLRVIERQVQRWVDDIRDQARDGRT